MTKDRRPLVAGNWKQHVDHVEAVHLVTELAMRLRSVDTSSVEVAVLAPFTDLRSVSSVIEADHLELAWGAQHVSEHDDGAFTGEVSGRMLSRLGAQYVLVGHSERRRLFGMDDATVGRTAAAARRAGLVPIVCVGERQEDREAGQTDAVVERQLVAALEPIAADPGALVVAYEPVWAIGAGQPATPQDAAAAAALVRTVATQVLGEGAQPLRVLYGGSVDADTAGALVAPSEVDGLLVGGASLQAASFVAVIEAVADCYRSVPKASRR